MAVEPFRIQIPDQALSDLISRVKNTAWPDQVEDIGWAQGMELGFMHRLAKYWANEYDWRRREAALNRFAQFRTVVGGDQRLHFIHQRPAHGADTGGDLPILLLNGWPSSFTEFTRLIPLLTGADGHAVVAPSLPGYGFSDPPKRAGMDLFAIADLLAELMTQLGYERFAVHGGNQGSPIGSLIALRHPGRVAALHMNFVTLTVPKPPGDTLPEDQAYGEALAAIAAAPEGVYSRVARTRPQTFAYAFTDSPIGLAAFIIEKFHDWSDRQDDVTDAISRDDLLDNVCVYWFTRTIASSMRLYWESTTRRLNFAGGEKVRVPCAVAHFPKEPIMAPRRWIEAVYNVTRWTEMERGGHFAPIEQPEALAKDMLDFLRPLRAGS